MSLLLVLLPLALLAAPPPAPPQAGPPAPATGPAVSWEAGLARPEDREGYERRLVAMVREARARVAAELGLDPPSTLAVTVHTREGFEKAFGADAAGNHAARLEGTTIHLNGGARQDDRMAGLLAHEMVHLALDARGTVAAIPLWVEEGLADRVSWSLRGQEAPSTGQRAELRQARDRGELLPLPTGGRLSRLQYLASWAAVVVLEGRSGRDRLASAIRAALDGEPFDRALRRETGWTAADAEREFDRWVAR